MRDDRSCESFPRVLYLADFPPSNLSGGPILLRRLLEGYPRDKIAFLIGSHYAGRSLRREERPDRMWVLPATNKTGPRGLGRLKLCLDLLFLPWVGLISLLAVKFRKAQVILSVVHGYFFLAAALSARLLRKPLVLFVHDDWVELEAAVFPSPWRRMRRAMLAWALRSAAWVYAVSFEMQAHLKTAYGVDSDPMLPGLDPDEAGPGRESDRVPEAAGGELRLLYAGSWSAPDCLEEIVAALKSPSLQARGVTRWCLQIYTDLDAKEFEALRLRWDDGRIHLHPWVEQEEARRLIREADILLLVHSFESKSAALGKTALSTKVADALASGRPILVLAPSDSGLCRYARARGFAETVDALEPETIAEAVWRIRSSPGRREQLRAAAEATFRECHDMSVQRANFHDRLRRLLSGGNVS